ncbi:MAG: Fur family transcriptional regulator [Planctomycetota bacterium]|jgi:Fur family ferric uptake transcriptional regulator
MLRSTQQREAIREALQAAAGPLLPEELLSEAQDACPSLGQATVYRALRQMEEAGEIQKVVVGDGRQRYEAAQPHHHHFHCRACRRVFDIDGCVRSPKLLGENLPRGFQLEGHELTLHGLCADCS